MKPTPTPETFDGWLQMATRTLPAHIQNLIQGELEDHYQDACAAHRQAGLEPDAARRAALADLGDPAAVNQGLRATYLSRGQALAAMLAAITYPFVLLALPALTAALGKTATYLLQDLLSTVLLVFILTTFIRLLGANTHRLERPAWILMGALLLGTVTRLVSFTVFGRMPLVGPDEEVIWRSGPALGMLLDAGFVIAEGLAAGASAWLGWRLFGMEERLYGLLRPVSILLMLVGPVGSGVALSLLLSSMTGAYLFSVLGYTLVTILLAVMILVFFRAAFRGAGHTLIAG